MTTNLRLLTQRAELLMARRAELEAAIREHRAWIVRECGEESANDADVALWSVLNVR